MADIYHDDGTAAIVDIHAARDALRSVGAISDVRARGHRIAEIQAAALLDIAYSLRPLGAEAADAMRERYPLELEETADGSDEPRRWAVGDLVHVIDDTEPGEIVKLGIDQGEEYADVAFANGADGRFYVRNLQWLDETDDEISDDAIEQTAAAVADEIEKGNDEVAAQTDDLDDEDPPAELGEDPLAKLRALESKSTKKGKKK